MLHWIYTIFVILHGLVHLFYLAWSQGRLIPEEGFIWNANSWLFTNWVGDATTRSIGMLLFGASALLFVMAGVGLAMRQPWSTNWLTVAAITSTLTVLAMWDGQMSGLPDKGFVGVLINVGFLAALYLFKFPAF